MTSMVGDSSINPTYMPKGKGYPKKKKVKKSKPKNPVRKVKMSL